MLLASLQRAWGLCKALVFGACGFRVGREVGNHFIQGAQDTSQPKPRCRRVGQQASSAKYADLPLHNESLRENQKHYFLSLHDQYLVHNKHNGHFQKM